jgi:hypothetical protein
MRLRRLDLHTPLHGMLAVSVRVILSDAIRSSEFIFLVNDILKGTGNAASKQLAKEEAARHAYYAMGWASCEFLWD